MVVKSGLMPRKVYDGIGKESFTISRPVKRIDFNLYWKVSTTGKITPSNREKATRIDQ